MIQAIFFDIDGTLVSFKTHTIPSSALEAIEQVRTLGIKVFIASGRMMPQINNLHGTTFDGYITLNGAYCINGTGELIYHNPIPQTDLTALLQYDRQNQNLPFTFMSNKRIAINHTNAKVAELCQLVDVPIPPIDNLHKMMQEETIYQINLFAEESLEKEVMDSVLTGCESSRWNPLFADVNVRGNSKETGMDAICRHYGIDIAHTLAIGDGGNDVSMLKRAAIGVAMGNAVPQAKAAADYVTATVDEDGVAEALYRFCIAPKEKAAI